MWMAVGSQHEPVYPPRTGYGHGDRASGRHRLCRRRERSPTMRKMIWRKWPTNIRSTGDGQAGDVVFFHSHVLHRSKKNFHDGSLSAAPL
jgi:hypothetical protein